MAATPKKNTPRRSEAPQADTAIRVLVRCFGLLDRVMRPHFAQFGVSGAQWGVLRNLQRAETEGLSGLRLSELGERLLVQPPSVTGVVDRLERLGLVTRTGVPEDLRAKQVALTAKGRTLVERILAAHPEKMAALLSGLERTEQGELHRLLDKLADHLTRMCDPSGEESDVARANGERGLP